jgi:hypothetical protein
VRATRRQDELKITLNDKLLIIQSSTQSQVHNLTNPTLHLRPSVCQALKRRRKDPIPPVRVFVLLLGLALAVITAIAMILLPRTVPILTMPIPATLLPLNTAAHSIKRLLSAVQTVVAPITVVVLVPVAALPVVVVVAPFPLPVRANPTIVARPSLAESILAVWTLRGIDAPRVRGLADVDIVVALMVAGLPVGDAVDTHVLWTWGK